MKIFSNRPYRLFALLLACYLLYINSLNAQNQSAEGLSPEAKSWLISTMEPWPEGKYKSIQEAMIDNKFFPPLLVFRGGLFPELDSTFNLSNDLTFPSSFVNNDKQSVQMFRHYQFLKSLDELVYRRMLSNPHIFKYSISQLPATNVKVESIDVSKEQVKIEINNAKPIKELIDPIVKYKPNRRYWTLKFEPDIKFSHNRSSKNWHQGSDINSLNLYLLSISTFKYERDKIALTNTLKTWLTLNNAPNDTLRKFIIINDEFRLNSVFELKAIKRWSYSLSAEIFTPMGNHYIANTKNKNLAFLTPLILTNGIGMTYNLVPKFKKPDRSLNLKLTINPLAFQFKYNGDTTVINGFPRDASGKIKYEQHSFGPNLELTKDGRFNKSLTFKTKYTYFTNYEKVTCHMDNSFDYSLNKYFSIKLQIILRYDDGIKRKEDIKSYWQINEVLTFGFKYTWQ